MLTTIIATVLWATTASIFIMTALLIFQFMYFMVFGKNIPNPLMWLYLKPFGAELKHNSNRNDPSYYSISLFDEDIPVWWVMLVLHVLIFCFALIGFAYKLDILMLTIIAATVHISLASGVVMALYKNNSTEESK